MTVFETLDFEHCQNWQQNITKQAFCCLQMPGWLIRTTKCPARRDSPFIKCAGLAWGDARGWNWLAHNPWVLIFRGGANTWKQFSVSKVGSQMPQGLYTVGLINYQNFTVYQMKSSYQLTPLIVLSKMHKLILEVMSVPYQQIQHFLACQLVGPVCRCHMQGPLSTDWTKQNIILFVPYL